MQKAIETLNKAAAPDGYISATNTFKRISKAESDEWLPLYYAAYACIVPSFEMANAGQKDQYLDNAQQFLDKAFEIAPEESELFALQAFLYPGKIMVDPMNRGPEYMEKIYQALDKATQLNPENPRPYLLRAATTLNMPAEFGGDQLWPNRFLKPQKRSLKTLNRHQLFIPTGERKSTNWRRRSNKYAN